ncbi:MAG TPA: nickel-binding protein [Gaiellaceae bacterium]
MNTLAYFTVELARPPDGWSCIPELAARARSASDELRREGAEVQFVRAVFVPEDDVCLHLYRAASADDARAAAGRAGLPFDGIAEAIAAGESDLDQRDVREEER